MQSISSIRARILIVLFIALFVLGALWFRAYSSAKEHYLAAHALPALSSEQFTELKRAGIFRAPFNRYASAALSELENQLDNPAARQAFCDAIFGSRHPLWNDADSIKKCRSPNLPRISLKEEAPLSFKGNALSFFTLLGWIAAMLGLIFRGFSETGSITPSARRWFLISLGMFLSWCASLIFV
jgi:hypothetical protein